MPDLAIATTSRRTGVSSGHTMTNDRRGIQGQARDTVEVPYYVWWIVRDHRLVPVTALDLLWTWCSLFITSNGTRNCCGIRRGKRVGRCAHVTQQVEIDSRIRSHWIHCFVSMLEEQRCEDRGGSMNELKLTEKQSKAKVDTTIRTSRHVITGTFNIATH